MELKRKHRLSKALTSIMLKTIDGNVELAKYLVNNTSKPLSGSSEIDNHFKFESLIMNKVKPYPFDDSSTTKEGSELRIFIHSGKMNTDGVVRDSLVIFDIIVAKSLWLVSDNGPELRPYNVMDCITEQLEDVSIPGVGKLDFVEYAHLMINEKFSGIRLFAEMTEFKTKNAV